MRIIDQKIFLKELKEMANKMFGGLVKAVVDVEKGIMAVDGELHADEEQLLLTKGSKQEHLWGINIYPDSDEEGFIEFDSMINLRPAHGNRTRGVEDIELRKKIIKIVHNLVKQ